MIARTSSFSFKDKHVDVKDIGKRLSVVHVLEGSCQASGDRVRIAVQLVDARTDTQLWSQTYDRKAEDLPAVQDEITAAVVAQLKLKMLARTTPPRPSDPKAHALILQARQLGRLGTVAGLEQSYALLQKALTIDPGDPLAWDNVAYYYEAKGLLGGMPWEEAMKQAHAAADKALASDPEFARAHARLGELAMDDGDMEAAAPHIQRALQLDPTSAVALGTASDLLAYIGRHQESIPISEYLAANDPINPSVLTSLASSYVVVGRTDEAIATYRTVLALTPGRQSALNGLAKALLASGKPGEALPVIAQIKDENWRKHYLVVADHFLGKQKESDALFAELSGKYGKDYPTSMAEMMAGRGEIDQAFAWLDKGLSTNPHNLSNAADDAELNKLKKDPRWLPFLRKIGRAPEQVAAFKLDVKVPDASAGLSL